MGLCGALVHPQDALGREFGRVPNLPWDPIERFWCSEVAIIACNRTQITISYRCGHYLEGASLDVAGILIHSS